MLASFVVVAFSLLLVLVVSVLHLPRWLQRLILWTPAWLQAATIHFGYGSWIGGVTGHVVGALLSISWFFVAKYWIQPMLARSSKKTAPVTSTI